jgi:hypothetical protein
MPKQVQVDLSIKPSRRQLGKFLLGELAIAYGSLQGQSSGSLAALPGLPDSEIGFIRPAILPECDVVAEQGHVCRRLKRTGALTPILPVDDVHMAVIKLFDGEHSVQHISDILAHDYGADAATAFSYVRTMFLLLVKVGACIPRDPPGYRP